MSRSTTTDAVKLYEENPGAAISTSGLEDLPKTKHLGTCYHYVNDTAHAGTVAEVPIPSSENKADELTKVVAKITFVKFRVDVSAVDRSSVKPGAIEKAY